MNCYEVSLGDTLGVGSPSDTRSLLGYLRSNGVPLARLAGHFHDTYGQALANVWEAYNCGLRTFDSSVAGLGGCPFAPGAKGNVATEDVVYMFDRAGISTGVDLAQLVRTGLWVSDKLAKQNGSRAGAALAAKDTPATPKETVRPGRDAGMSWTQVRETETEGLLVHRSGANIKITMSRPRNGNALTTSMIAGLTSIFSAASKDPSINRIALTGRGKFFCTGMDLGKQSTRVGSGDQAAHAQFEALTNLFETMDNCPKVTIASVNGPAFGGGVGLAFACDVRRCARDARFTLSEVKLGLCPAAISKYVTREWGIPFSREAMLSARPISPVELHTKGIVTGMADDAVKLKELLDSYMQKLRVASPDASQMCKELVRESWASSGQQRQSDVIQHIFKEMMKPDAPGQYGVKEFQAGRTVDWDNANIPSSVPRSKL